MKQLFSLKYRCRVSDRSYEFTTEGKNEVKITLQKEKKISLVCNVMEKLSNVSKYFGGKFPWSQNV